MDALIEKIRGRLRDGAYSNEAAISHGVVMPILGALGWDTTDPLEVAPEFTSGKGRVDFALCGLGRKPAIFVEVKGVGRAVEGDRQLFEYAFHQGVPLCVLTDGREWSFYLPSGHGSYDDRRLYRLQLDERSPAECREKLQRYMGRDRVRSGDAFEDAQRDYRNAAARREAAQMLPKAWMELVAEPEELLVELLSDRAEALSGFRPAASEVEAFLRTLTIGTPAIPYASPKPQERAEAAPLKAVARATTIPSSRAVAYRVFGEQRSAANANDAFVDVLRMLAVRFPSKLDALAAAVKSRSRNHIARSEDEIYPGRPELARAIEIHPGWLVGLNIANREKIKIIRAACSVFGIEFGREVEIVLPNAPV